MPFENLFQPLVLARGPQWRNRFALAPLTNQQSRPDGVLTDAEIHWLTLRARGGFGLVMTAAAHVQAVGQGFPGQLGVFGDQHLAGLSRLAEQLRASGAASALQLHHAGAKSAADLTGQPVAPSDDPATGARALTLDEVRQLRDDFIAAAVRAKTAGFDGVEVHGAHGYILTQFLAEQTNHRQDRYGGSLENRMRLLFEVLDGIRASTGRGFQLGVRLSVERFGVTLMEARETVRQILAKDLVDYIDLSMWDVFKETAEPEHRERPLLGWFTDLERGPVRLGAAGRLTTPDQCEAAIAAGLDFVTLGRAGILHHDYPDQLRRSADFVPAATPVPPEHLAQEGLSPVFVDYMKTFKGFVAEPAE